MSLFRPGFDNSPYTYKGEHLREIAFPLGGIGTGCVSLDGRGNLRDWEIFGRPNKGKMLAYTFPALWLQPEGEEARALALQGPRVRDFVGESMGYWSYGHGHFFSQMDGLPCFDSIEFAGTFPFARIRFHKENFPLKIELSAFNPFIPQDTQASSYPCASLNYRIENTGDKPVELCLAWTMLNPVHAMMDATETTPDKTKNTYRQGSNCRGIFFENERFSHGELGFGTASLTTSWSNVDYTERWEVTGWWDCIATFWNRFRETGTLGPNPESDSGKPMSGSLGCRVKLVPGEVAEIPFLIAWHFPIIDKYWGKKEPGEELLWTQYYATQHTDAWAVADDFFGRFDELADRTSKFEDALLDSTLPKSIIECVSATASILHTPTVIRLEDGGFWAWEGCSPQSGCCEGTCSHVWNYALTHACLFPDIQRSFLDTAFKFGFNCGGEGKKGALNFRMILPLAKESYLWHAASDGQLGQIIQIYRDWRWSGDDAWLKEIWPKAHFALEYSWVQWDRDQDGLVDGDMHNTYDINFQGPNPLTQFFYLGALSAAEEICRHLGDAEHADKYQALIEKGAKATKERLWNGDFFIQENPYTEADAPKYQHGHGCLTDQVFGQLCAEVAGLGDLIDRDLVTQTLRSIYRHNFRDPLGDHENLQRVYAFRDETGLLLCSWPSGGRPHYPFPYSDEAWTGIEYQVATHLAYHGLRDEAESIARAIRKRHDGKRRNPWNEYECGSHYARALASYGLFLAWTGLRYDGIDGTLEAQKEPFKSFFSVPGAWGTVERMPDAELRVDVIEGRLSVKPEARLRD
ncbi:MAG: hypothetical protein KF784_15650 [Fimbriimonadaceae bacterium]|nr:hypothetical protein [Fimbriimonadaceae bacterium]